MAEPLILCIETALNQCSVAVTSGSLILSQMTESEKNKAAERLHVMIEDVCQSASIKIQQLDAIAISGGPGSYTGLRIGAAAAKGLCYGLNIPLIHIETTQAMHAAAHNRLRANANIYIILIDARRMDAYAAILDKNGDFIETPSIITLEEETFSKYTSHTDVLFVGNAINKFSEVSINPKIRCLEVNEIMAIDMATIAHRKWLSKTYENLAYYEPNYYKSFFLTQKKQIR